YVFFPIRDTLHIFHGHKCPCYKTTPDKIRLKAPLVRSYSCSTAIHRRVGKEMTTTPRSHPHPSSKYRTRSCRETLTFHRYRTDERVQHVHHDSSALRAIVCNTTPRRQHASPGLRP